MSLLLLQINTFQAIVITDSLKSYSVFTYKNNSLQWSGLDGFYNEAVVGYNMDGVFKNQPLSGTKQILNIAKKPDLVTVQEVGNLDNDLQRARKQCFQKFLADRDMYGSSVVQRSQVTQPCPCSIFQAWSERRFIYSSERSVFQYNENGTLCFSQFFPSAFGSGQLCCYSYR